MKCYKLSVSAYFNSTFERMKDGRLCLRVGGELDGAAGPVLCEAIASCVLTRPIELVLDLDGLTFMDCSGLRVLIDGRRFARETRVPLLLRRVPAPVRRVLELTGTADCSRDERTSRASRPYYVWVR